MAHIYFCRMIDISDDYYAGKITEEERKARASALWTEITAAGPAIVRAVKGYMRGPRS